MDDLTYASATALARAIAKKEVSSEEVVRAHLQRIEAVNPELNAVVQLAAERALEEARKADAVLVARHEDRGPLHGVPFTLKDSIETAGVVTTGGTLGRAKMSPWQSPRISSRHSTAGCLPLCDPQGCFGLFLGLQGGAEDVHSQNAVPASC